jgi:cytochrome oxidase Cu insertion factor (SCO1/SenC/PrrC family)
MKTGLLTMMKSLRKRILFLTILAGMSFGSLAGMAQENLIGDIADDFELVNVMTGDPVRLSDFEGSIVLLDFFFYW